jgi:uncharacterized membrane protein YfcA
MTITGHAVSGNLTPFVWQNYVLILPAIVLGIVAGLVLDRFLSPALFRKIVLVLLMGLGVRMIGLAL